MNNEEKPKRPLSSFITALCGVVLIVFFFFSRPPVTLGFDPNDEKCLPDLHLALLVHTPPKVISDSDYLIFKPNGVLSYVGQEYVLKQVQGVPGDHLLIKNGEIYINDKLITKGLPLSSYYHKKEADFSRNEIIPQGKYFLMGTHPNSDDSRYWGYLSQKSITGHAYKLF